MIYFLCRERESWNLILVLLLGVIGWNSLKFKGLITLIIENYLSFLNTTDRELFFVPFKKKLTWDS